MKTNYLLLGVLVAAACGDNKAAPKADASVKVDAPPIDAPAFPAPPALGAQVDRMGRPTINTALNHVFDPTAAAGSAKDAYNADGSPASWVGSANVGEFAKNLAIFDALDSKTTPGDGCGNQIGYNGNLSGGGSASLTSYAGLATFLADDQLYFDTNKTSCTTFLAIELDYLSGSSLPHTTCGGRTPSYDVVDANYSALAAGIAGFNLGTSPPTPLIGDGVGKHTDVSDTDFPFLGAPH